VALAKIILILEKLKKSKSKSKNVFSRKMKNFLKSSGIFYYTKKKIFKNN
jgi:hypothetical protein